MDFIAYWGGFIFGLCLLILLALSVIVSIVGLVIDQKLKDKDAEVELLSINEAQGTYDERF